MDPAAADPLGGENRRATAQVVETILASRPIPEQGFRAGWGIMRLGKRYGEGRLEEACQLAIRIGACLNNRYRINSQTRPRPAALAWPRPAATAITHGNIRARSITTQQRRIRTLNHPTLDKLLTLSLTGMAKALSEQWTSQRAGPQFRGTPGPPVDREMTARSDRRLTTRLRQAKLRLSASAWRISTIVTRAVSRISLSTPVKSQTGWKVRFWRRRREPLRRYWVLAILQPFGIG